MQIQTKVSPIRRRPAAWLLAALLAVAPASAFGQELKEDSDTDGRLEGYDTKVAIDKSSTTPTWFLFFFLTIVACGALFKTAKRE